MDPVLEAALLALVKATPHVVHVVSDALRGGDTPEVAIAKAKAATPPRIDTTEDDAARRRRLGV